MNSGWQNGSIMTIADALTTGQKVLSNSLESEILLAHTLKSSREHLVSHSEEKLTQASYKRYFGYLSKRKRGVPIAYLIHRKEFYGLSFYVDENVLVPRPETEMLVEETIKKCQMLNVKCQIIYDVGTGSGCIAIALAKNLPNAKIVATDISKNALKIAKKNAKIHGVDSQITFLESDLLEGVMVPFDFAQGRLSPHHDTINIIVANLPYISRSESSLVDPDVKKYEPSIALWAGYDGCKYLNKLFIQIKKMKFPPAYVIGEFGFSMKKKVEKLIKKLFPKAKVTFNKDLAGYYRIFILNTYHVGKIKKIGRRI